MNCQIRGLASIRKGLGTENTPFLVSFYSIIASENVFGRELSENFKSPGKAIFTNGGFPIRKGPKFCQSGGVPILPIRRVLFLPIRKSPIFANPEGYYFCQTEGVLFLPIRRGTVFCQSGGVPILPIRRVQILPIQKGPIFVKT